MNRSTRKSTPHLGACLAAALALAALPARADICQAIDKATAEAGAKLIRAAGVIVYDDWFVPTPVRHVEVRPWENLYEVVVNGAISVDLAHAYLPGDGETYASLGWQVGCGDPIIAKAVPTHPFVATLDPPPPWAPDGARIIGVVEAPRLYDAYLAMGELQQPAILRAGPAADAAVVREVFSFDDVPQTEVDYEHIGLAVYERRDGWFRVIVDGAPAWLAPEEAGPFHDLATLLTTNLSYLDYGWDGLLFDAPDRGATKARIDPDWRVAMGEQIEVDVRASRLVGDALWLRVDVIWPSPCSGEDPVAVASGWVPAYGAKGGSNAWYYSRGC